MGEEHPLQVARCTKIIRLDENAPPPALAPGQKPNADEQDKYVINVKQIAKFVVALGDRVAPTDIEEGMRVGSVLPLPPSHLQLFPGRERLVRPDHRNLTPRSVDRTDYKIMIPLPPKIDASVTMMQVEEKPDVTYQDVGGCKEQIEKLREVVETPLLNVSAHSRLSLSLLFTFFLSSRLVSSTASNTGGAESVTTLAQPERFVELGIDPPKGVMLYGPPGTGKTLCARAVANRTDATFIRVIGSELVQKYVGEGARMVRELFEMARSKKAAIIFFDEVDAIGGARFDDGAGGDNEVQRTMLELINQLDGFDARGNIKVLMATNRCVSGPHMHLFTYFYTSTALSVLVIEMHRPDTLDPALLRPGRIDRRVEFGLPDAEGRAHILRIHAYVSHVLPLQEPFLSRSNRICRN